MAFSSGEPVAYATGSPTIRSGSVALIRSAPTGYVGVTTPQSRAWRLRRRYGTDKDLEQDTADDQLHERRFGAKNHNNINALSALFRRGDVRGRNRACRCPIGFSGHLGTSALANASSPFRLWRRRYVSVCTVRQNDAFWIALGRLNIRCPQAQFLFTCHGVSVKRPG